MKFTVPEDFQRSFSIQELVSDRLSLVGHLFVASFNLDPFSYKQIPLE